MSINKILRKQLLAGFLFILILPNFAAADSRKTHVVRQSREAYLVQDQVNLFLLDFALMDSETNKKLANGEKAGG